MLETDSSSSTTLCVVIPTWRRHQQLSALLHALHRQTRRPDEVLVVCRDGDQESIASVQEWALSSDIAARHKVIKVDREGHLPPLIAALEHCESEIFCLIDDDAIPREDWLLQLEKDFRDPKVGGIGGKIINHTQPGASQSGRPPIEAPGKLSWFGRSGGYGRRKPDAELFEADCLIGCNMAFRRIALAGCFDMVLNQGSAMSYETDVAMNIKKTGLDVYFDPNSVVDHYLTPRKIESQRGWNPQECYVYAHNLTYICLKHLTWYGKLGFAIYFFLVGSWGCPGPITFLLSFVKRHPASWRQQLLPSMKGRVYGIRAYCQKKS